jgi:tRNA(fMet)-specific endonuclease VapC
MTNYVLVDTDVFSYLWQNRPEGVPYAPILQGSIPVLSFTSVAEVYFGAHLANWGEQRMRSLESALKPYLVVPYSQDLAKLWGQLKSQARRSGHSLGQNEHSNDLWICATAVLYGAPIVTNNKKHFEGMPGAQVLTAASGQP